MENIFTAKAEEILNFFIPTLVCSTDTEPFVFFTFQWIPYFPLNYYQKKEKWCEWNRWKTIFLSKTILIESQIYGSNEEMCFFYSGGQKFTHEVIIGKIKKLVEKTRLSALHVEEMFKRLIFWNSIWTFPYCLQFVASLIHRFIFLKNRLFYFRCSFWLHALQQHMLVARLHIQSALWVEIMHMWVVQTNTPSKYVNMQIFSALFFVSFLLRLAKKTKWNIFFESHIKSDFFLHSIQNA